MPELPEVEFARQQILTWTTRRRVVRVSILESTVVGPRVRTAAWRGARTHAVLRRGKTLLWQIAGQDEGVILHLGMTGSLRRQPVSAPTPLHTRVAWRLDDGSQILLVDPRRFGRVVFGRAKKLAEDPALCRSAVDPLADRFTPRDLAEGLRSSRVPVKIALMDQDRIQGIGNIYASEACFRARLDPRTPAADLDGATLRRLHSSVLSALRHGLRVVGDPGGVVRYAQAGGENPFLIYGRDGEPCPRCAAPIRRIVQANRGTWLCEPCQSSTGTNGLRGARRTP